MRSVLLIDDSADCREDIEMVLTDESLFVVTVPCPHDAFAALERESFDVILCDLHLPFILDERIHDFPYSIEVGIQTIRTLRETFPEIPIIGITASMPSDTARIESDPLIGPLLQKPFTREKLAETLHSYALWTCRDQLLH